MTGNINAPAWGVQVSQGSCIMTINKNTTINSKANIDLGAVGKIGIGSGSDCNISVMGAYKQKITGAARLQYVSTLDERHEGHYKLYTGDDTSTEKVSGKTDHSCPTTRSTTNNCNTAATIS